MLLTLQRNINLLIIIKMAKKINTQAEVESFLQQFMPKFSIWGIFFLDREKNKETLKVLDMSPQARENIIKSLDSIDYVETIQDMMIWGDMWVFGKDIYETEIYIKIAMGQPSSNTICISFHIAEHPINYAFK